MNHEPFTSIENPTLAHFRHIRHFKHFILLYTCRELSTNQLLNMQNKPNLVRRRRIANSVYTMDYENKWPWRVRKNKPNSNPIKTNFKRAKMNINLTLTKDYRKNDDFVVRINKPNFRNGQNERKFTYSKGLQKKRLFSIPQNKPNSNPIFSKAKIACRKIWPHLPFKVSCFSLDLSIKKLIVIFYKAVIARNILKRLSYGKEPG